MPVVIDKKKVIIIFFSILGLKSAPEEVYIQQPKVFKYSSPSNTDALFVLKLNKAM